MSLVVGTNTSAQFAQDALRANQHKTATAMQRLSTGLRINSARDDAAGLAISQSMTSQIRGLNQAVRNINDGINLLQTAEGGLGSITDMLQRMRELAVQSANGTNSSSQRAYLQKEAAALQEQISTIADTTTWNDKKLLDGSFTGQKIQVGADIGATMDVDINPALQINGNSTAPTPPASPPVIHSTAMDGSIYMVGRTTMSNLEGQPNAGGRDAFITKYAPDGTIAWTKMIGTTGDETARAVTTGSDGMIYVTGSTTGNLDGQLNNGTWSDGFISKFNSDGTKLWTREFGAAGSLADEGRAIATGPDGGIYVTGYTNSNQLQGAYTTDLVTYSPSHNPTTDAFLTKYSSDGSVLWTQLLTSVNFDVGNAITIGTDGSVFLAGITAGNLDGQVNGGGGGGSGIGDGFVTKYSADGTKLSTKLTGTSAWEASNAIKVGSDGSIYVAGSESNGGSVTNGSFTKYLPDGTKAWTQYIAGDAWDIAKSLTIGLDGAVYVAGNTNSSNFPGHSSYNSDAFVRKYAADGTEIWTQFVWGQGDDIGNALATGVDGSIYLSGVLGPTAFLTKFLPDGSQIYTKQFGGEGVDGSATISFGLTIGKDVVLDPPVVLPPVTPNPSSAIDLSTAAGASSAIGVIDSTLDSVNSTRSKIGSYINRLNYAADNATNISTNLSASRSAIMDTDYAEESANLAKSQIVQQAATAMLAQANQQPQSVLALLKNL